MPPRNFEILHALKCVLGAFVAPFHACIRYIHLEVAVFIGNHAASLCPLHVNYIYKYKVVTSDLKYLSIMNLLEKKILYRSVHSVLHEGRIDV